MDKEKLDKQKQIEKEAVEGILPTSLSDRKYGLADAFLILSGYAIATWCYTQGAYMAEFTNLKQLFTSNFGANLFYLGIYLLAVFFASRYGIDMWQWFKSTFGPMGVKVIVTLVILVNFPWFGVCCDIFASSCQNLMALFGHTIGALTYKILGAICAFSGCVIAIAGPVAIKWANRIIVPLLLGVGVLVMIVGFRAVPASELFAYQPDLSGFADSRMPYALAVESGFAFGLSWSCSTAVTPRLCKKERDGYFATLAAYGVVAPFFVLAGGVLGIATYITTGVMEEDITVMLATLSGRNMALLVLALVVFANIATMGTGCYLWSVVLKSAYPKVNYNYFTIGLSAYAFIIVMWGKIIEYFGTMITLSALIYGPIMFILLVDYWFVKKRKIDLRSIYNVDGHDAYDYKDHLGFNILGFVTMFAGVAAGLLIYDPLGGVERSVIFYYCPSSLFSGLVSGILYYLAYKIPSFKGYLLRDAKYITR